MRLSRQSLVRWSIVATIVVGAISLSSIFALPEHVYAQGAGATVDNSAEVDAKGGFNLLDIGTWLPAATATIASIFLTIAALLAGLAVTALNAAVDLLVFNFGVFFGNSAGLLAGWSVLRDIGNILLLFGFVSIGVQTILNINHFNVGKTLPRLILFAILLNFSLFVTEAIIDATNGVASVVYMQADSTGNTGSAIGGQSGIISIVNAAQSIGEISGKTDTTKTYIYLLLALFLFIATFALLAGAILLVTRAVVLVFLMLTSPIGFAGMAIPRLNQIAEQWWSALIGNALFAPAYLILLLVSLKMLNTLPQVAGSSGSQPNLIAAAIGNGAEMGQAVILFFLTVGFLLLSVMAAKQFGVMGASFATKTAGALAYGVPGFIGRKTVGVASNRAARAIRSTGWGTTMAGRGLARLADVGAKASFDVRSATPLKAALKAGKIDAGSPSKVAKGGRREELNDIRKRASENAELYEKARKTTDGIQKDKIAVISREENIERAKAEQADTLAKSARDKGFTGLAETYEKQRDLHLSNADGIKYGEKAEAEKKLEKSQLGRISADDRLLYKSASGKTPREAGENDATNAVKEHLANIDKHLSKMESLTDEIVRLQKNAAGRNAGDPEKANIEARIRDLKEKHSEETEALNREQQQRKDAERKLYTLQSQREKQTKTADKQYLDPSYALQQIAQSFDRLARSPIGVIMGGDFREAARGIRGNAGQSKEARLAHDLQHMLEHASHGDDHDGEDHKEEKHDDGNKGGGAAGGGGHDPAAH